MRLWENIIGCDIGNAFAYASVFRGKSAEPLPLMSEKTGHQGMPTDARLSAPDGTPIQVYYSVPGADGPVVRAVKRHFQEKALTLPNTIQGQVTPWDVYAAVVRDLVRGANEVAVSSGREKSYDVVFTFPAIFADPAYLSVLNRMEQSIRSVTLDGRKLNVVGRLPEPAAAALYYLYFVQNLAPEGSRFHGDTLSALVIDVGHGTTDLALVIASSRGDPYKLALPPKGLEQGGMDFDQLIYDELCSQLFQKYQIRVESTSQQNQLLRLAQEAKRQLSIPGVELYPVSLDWSDDDRYELEIELEITRARFEELSAPMINRMLELTLAMLSEAKKKELPVDRIILTGGASRMPMVERSLHQLLDEEKYRIESPFQPSRAVSFGAAIYGANIPKPEPNRVPTAPAKPKPNQTPSPEPKTVRSNNALTQMTAGRYGFKQTEPGQINYTIKTMLEHGQTLPATSAPVQYKSPSGELRFRIVHTESESGPMLDAKELEWLTLSSLPKDRPVSVTMTVDEGYNVTIRAEVTNGKFVEDSTGRFRRELENKQ